AQEAANTGSDMCIVGAFSPGVEATIDRRAAELAAQAPPLTARQIARLREIFANSAGGGSR
ncbi:MAG: hypothetical protein WCP21_20510, partial [Armatimonadota bacterium]